MVVLSGKIAAARQYITLPMQQAINTYCMTQIREKTQIVSSELGMIRGCWDMRLRGSPGFRSNDRGCERQVTEPR